MMNSADDSTTSRPSSRLSSIDSSIARVLDGSCEVLETGLREAANLAGESCRPYVENIGRRTSHHARKAAHTTKEGTSTMLHKLDPMVTRRHYKSR